MSTTSLHPNTDFTPPTESLDDSLAYCRQVTREKARNFYYGLKLVPEPKRSALYAVYAWMRAADDLADAPSTGSTDPAVTRRAIEIFRRQTVSALDPDAELPDGLLWPAFHNAARSCPIPHDALHAMLDGQLLDLTQHRYADFRALHDYCYKVASTVGLVCINIWGYDGDASTRQMAVDRGVALQLTNILRDLVEDARRNRVYIPADELAAHGLTPDQFRDFLLHPAPETVPGPALDAFDRLMRPQLERAAEYYRRSAALESRLDPACRPAAWAIMSIYHRLLQKIARHPRRVLSTRLRLGALQKTSIALRATWQRSVG